MCLWQAFSILSKFLSSCEVHFCDTLTNAFARHKSLITHTKWQCQLNAWHEHMDSNSSSIFVGASLCFGGCFAFGFGHVFGSLDLAFGSGSPPAVFPLPVTYKFWNLFGGTIEYQLLLLLQFWGAQFHIHYVHPHHIYNHIHSCRAPGNRVLLT